MQRAIRILLALWLGLVVGLPAKTLRGEEENVETLRARLEQMDKEWQAQFRRLEEKNEILRQDLIRATSDSATRSELKDKPSTNGPGALAPAKPPGEPTVDEASETLLKSVGRDLDFKTSWRDGLTAETSDRAFRIHVGGRFDIDWGWFTSNRELELPQPVGVGQLEDGAGFRRAWVRVDGTIWEIIEFVSEYGFEPALQGSTDHPRIADTYFDVTRLPVVGNFRTGHFREPFGLEALQSANSLTLLERSGANEAFVPFRNLGMMLYDTNLDGRMTWAVCLARSNSRDNGNPFDNGDGEYAGTIRLTCLPWYEDKGQRFLHLGTDFSHRSFSRNPDQDRLRLRATPGIRVGPYFFVDTGSLLAESSDLLGLEFGLALGPISFQAEYFHMWAHDVGAATALGEPSFHGWYAQLSYFLTGEHRGYDHRRGTFGRPRPRQSFLPTGEGGPDAPTENRLRGWGAWEVGARYSMVDATDPSQGAFGQTLHDVSLSLKWYLNANAYIQWDYIVALREFELYNNRGVAHILGMRFHIDF